MNGEALPPDKVNAARSEEVGFMKERNIWTLKPIQECWDKTGKPPVSVRWVDTNKGDQKCIIMRSRLVARDFKGGDKGRGDLFADTPSVGGEALVAIEGGNAQGGWEMAQAYVY